MARADVGSAPPSQSDSSGGLPTTAKVLIGVPVPVGSIAILALFGFVFIHQRRRRRSKQQGQDADPHTEDRDTDVMMLDGNQVTELEESRPELPGLHAMAELASTQKYELAGDTPSDDGR